MEEGKEGRWQDGKMVSREDGKMGIRHSSKSISALDSRSEVVSALDSRLPQRSDLASRSEAIPKSYLYFAPNTVASGAHFLRFV